MRNITRIILFALVILALPGVGWAAVPWTQTLIPPPAMVDPLIIDDVCPGETGWPTQAQQAGRDVKFILPTDRDCTFKPEPENHVSFFLGGTEKNPARNIWWIGGKILAPPAWGETGFPQIDPTTNEWPNGITLKWVKGTAYFEGLHADMRCTCRDVIAAANLGNYENGATLTGVQPAEKTPKIIVVNSILENPLQCTYQGKGGSIHGDIIHSQGSGTRPEIWLQNVMFRHGFQGLYLDNSSTQPAGHGATRIQLDHVQVRKRSEVNCQRTEGKAGTTGSVMWNVAPRDGVYFRKTWMVKGATTNPGAAIVNNCATYASSAGVKESDWCVGTNPLGDPATPDHVGRNYVREFFSGGEPPPPPTAPVITIEAVDSVVERGTGGTVQRVRIKRTGDTSSSSTVTYTATPSGTNQALTSDFSPAVFPTGTVTFTGDVSETFTLRKSWTATATTADYSFFAPANSAFTSAQTPWGAYDMGAGDMFNAEAYTGSAGTLRQRVITGPLRLGNGLPKGSPNVTFNDHFDFRPAIRPFGDGVWSNSISELKATVGGTATSGSTGGYARALQIHGFRTAYTGSAWDQVSTTDGDTYDIQIRYGTFGDFPHFSNSGSDVFRERKQIGQHTWDIYRTNGGWASDLGMTFVLTSDVNSISNVDLKAILDYTLADANARYGRSDTGIYVRGIQAWIEPRDGTVDATIEGMSVTYNGQTYR